MMIGSEWSATGPDYNWESASVVDLHSWRPWCKAYIVVDHIPEPLFAAKVSLRRLNTDMTK
jgi:hypothetical protein